MSLPVSRPIISRLPAFRPTSLLPLALLLGALASGCGGGGGGAVNNAFAPSPDSAPTTYAPADTAAAGRFVPNYNSEVETVRKWGKTRLSVYVAAPGGAGFANAQEQVRQGFALWESPLNGSVAFDFTQNPDADIVVTFKSKGGLGDFRVGATRVSYRSSNNEIVKAQIELDESLDGEYMAQVAAHEAGHALGVDGHSSDASDLMFSYAHLPAQITARDSNTLLTQYATSRAAFTPAAVTELILTDYQSCEGGPAHSH
jgi:hypothetical protein